MPSGCTVRKLDSDGSVAVTFITTAPAPTAGTPPCPATGTKRVVPPMIGRPLLRVSRMRAGFERDEPSALGDAVLVVPADDVGDDVRRSRTRCRSSPGRSAGRARSPGSAIVIPPRKLRFDVPGGAPTSPGNTVRKPPRRRFRHGHVHHDGGDAVVGHTVAAGDVERAGLVLEERRPGSYECRSSATATARGSGCLPDPTTLRRSPSRRRRRGRYPRG